MTQYDSVNVTSNSLLDKSESATKKAIVVTLRLSINIIGNANDDNNFQHELLFLMYRLQIFVELLHVICLLIWNYQKQIIIEQKISKVIKSVGFLGKLFRPLLESCWPLAKNVCMLLAKSALIP